VTGLLERDDEMAVLAGRYEQAADGRGGVVLLSGEAGMGKTSLVEHFAVSVRGGPVKPSAFLVGRCDDLHTPIPLGAVHDLAMLAPDPARAALLAARDAATAAGALLDPSRPARCSW
jgi:predicted ATPase